MLRFRYLPGAGRLSAVLALTVTLAFTAGDVGAEQVGHQLQLEVVVNGSPTNLIGSFTLLQDRRIAVQRAELKEIGLEARGYRSSGDLIILDEVVGLSYVYEEATQRISITAPEELRVVKDYDALPGQQQKIPVQSDYGAVLNYNLFAASGMQTEGQYLSFNGGSTTLDARAFTPFGTLSQSGIVRTSSDNQAEALRLNTTFAYSDEKSLNHVSSRRRRKQRSCLDQTDSDRRPSSSAQFRPSAGPRYAAVAGGCGKRCAALDSRCLFEQHKNLFTGRGRRPLPDKQSSGRLRQRNGSGRAS